MATEGVTLAVVKASCTLRNKVPDLTRALDASRTGVASLAISALYKLDGVELQGSDRWSTSVEMWAGAEDSLRVVVNDPPFRPDAYACTAVKPYVEPGVGRSRDTPDVVVYLESRGTPTKGLSLSHRERTARIGSILRKPFHRKEGAPAAREDSQATPSTATATPALEQVNVCTSLPPRLRLKRKYLQGG
jgi:hypothetical protein